MEEVLAELDSIEQEIGRTRFHDVVSGSVEDVEDRLSNLEGAVRRIVGLMKAACKENEG